MPTYEYLCESCSHRFETWQKMTDEPLTTCPVCGQHIHRVLFATGVVFKGSGFYKTDYGKNGRSPNGEHGSNGDTKKAETSTDSAASSNGDGKSESKSGTTSSESAAKAPVAATSSTSSSSSSASSGSSGPTTK